MNSTERCIENNAKTLVSYRLNSRKSKYVDFKTHFSENAFRGLIPTEPFNHGSNVNIFQAANQCVKAAYDIFITEKDIDFKMERNFSGALIVYPVIVLDGKLFSASLEQSGDLSIEEKEWIVYDCAITFKARRLPTRHILVDIVTRKYFEKYLSDLEDECLTAKLGKD